MLRIGFICPVYKAVELDFYTRMSLTTFFATTPHGVAIVVDDGSKSWTPEYENSLRELGSYYGTDRIHIKHFNSPGGLTRSWNHGLAVASRLALDYCIAGNNDVIFTYKWYEGMLHALNSGYDLVGPLSNAPGVTAKGKQEVEKYLKSFTLTDDVAELTVMAAELYAARLGHVIESKINGFFQLASMASWQRGMYDSHSYYRPLNRRMSSGRTNSTPTMTGNEDELQSRWSKQGMKSAIVLSSFIFHYRAVSRGDKYKRGHWYRHEG